MQGWRGSFALGKRLAALGAALLSLVAVVAHFPAAGAGAGVGGSIVPIDPIGPQMQGTSLTLATSATSFTRSSSVTLTATVRPGATGSVNFAANGADLGTVIVAVAYSPDVCPPPGTASVNQTEAGGAAVQPAQQSSLAAGSAVAATGCESQSFGAAALTVPANTLPAGNVLIEAFFVSSEPMYGGSLASVNLTVTDAAAPQVSFMAIPRGAGYDSNWMTFVPSRAAGVPGRCEWDFNGDGVVDVIDASCAVQQWHYPQPGSYTVNLALRDGTAVVFRTSQVVKVPNPPPVISNYLPLGGSTLPVGAKPTINATLYDPLGVDPRSVEMLLDDVNVTAFATVTATSVSYTPTAALAAGPHNVQVTAANTSGSVAQMSWSFEVAAVRTYTVNVVSPLFGQTVTNPSLSFVVEADTNEGGVSGVTVNAQPLDPIGLSVNGAQRYGGQVTLVDGQNTLSAVATFADGQTRSASVGVVYDAPPRVAITSPADKAVFGRALASSPGNLTGSVDRPITVTGQVARPVQSVTINQQQAQLDAAGLNFSFPNFFLHEGANLLNVVATDDRGRTGSATLSLSVDQTAPILNVESPRAGAFTRAGWVDVRGMVNDAVEAGFGAAEPQVFVAVNGQPEQAAVVADRYFQLNRLPLSHGLNRLSLRAVDSLGNERTQTLDVHKVDTGLAGLVAVDGQDQTGPGRTELPKPLVVLALDANGEPLANQAIDFIVDRGTGSLSPTQGQTASGNPGYTARAISVATNAQGRASVWFTIGKQSGPGANLVRAASPAVGGEPVLFMASTLRSPPARITADMGINQIGETDAQVMEILSAVIRDSGDNYLPGVRVQFRVEEGSAKFLDAPGATVAADGQSIMVTTDKNGVAAVRPLLGSQPGVVRISAQAATTAAADFSDPNAVLAGATYVIRAKQAGDGPTSFSGFIYSDKGQPLQGGKVSIGRTALLATTDDKGYFEITNVPPGRIDLFVDGRAVNPSNDPTRPQWPSLHFEAYVVRGQRNELPHAVYLPALLTSEAKVVGGNEDVVLTIPGLEGFRMTVKANSVTFPDGSRTGMLVVSPVTADKLPMAPPAGGAQFGVPAWTIQPAGARFDPPIEVRMPNSTNEQPGDNLPVVQWDHDLSQYVPMGRATVSSDGAWLSTDAGSGITKAGWGGVCRYDPSKCAASSLPELTSAKILVQGWKDSDDAVEPVNKQVRFAVDLKYKNCTPSYEWDLDGVKYSGSNPGKVFQDPKKVNVKLTVSCKATCKQAVDPPKIEVQRDLYATKLTWEAAWSDQFPGSVANGWDSRLPLFHGNATGPGNKPYALMAVRNDDNGYVRVKYKLEPQDAAVRAAVRFNVFNTSTLTSNIGESGGCPDATGPIGAFEACIKIQSPSLNDFTPIAGVDRDKDGKLDKRDWPEKQFLWKFRIVSRASYAAAIADYNIGVVAFGSLGQEWLKAFRDGTTPGGGAEEPDIRAFTNTSRTVLDSGLTHAVGAVTSSASGRTGLSKQVSHGPKSKVVQEIMKAPAFVSWVQDAVQAMSNVIDTKLGVELSSDSIYINPIPGIGKVPKLTIFKSATDSHMGEMYAVIGDAQIFNPTLRLAVLRDWKDKKRIIVANVRFVATKIEDVFDWDYDVVLSGVSLSGLPIYGPMARAGAMLQAAHGTIGGQGGGAFKNVYYLDEDMPLPGSTLVINK